jgi:hypothetical protein
MVARSIRRVLLDTGLYRFLSPVRNRIHYLAWDRKRRPLPPPALVKQRAVSDHAKRYRITTLVETGTYLGDMVSACRGVFERIISIELDPDLHARAKQRFARNPSIELLLGDSGTILRDVLERQTSPCVFWLDAHYSAGLTAKGRVDSPILEELRLILKHPVAGHVILIDDARAFGSDDAYPSLQALAQWVASLRPDLVFEVRDDIVRLLPARA